MPLIGQPPNQTAVNDVNFARQSVTVNQGWAQFFSTVFALLVGLTQSGTTAQRPTTGLFIGRTYFDITLNRPIWYTGTNWIRADGVVV